MTTAWSTSRCDVVGSGCLLARPWRVELCICESHSLTHSVTDLFWKIFAKFCLLIRLSNRLNIHYSNSLNDKWKLKLTDRILQTESDWLVLIDWNWLTESWAVHLQSNQTMTVTDWHKVTKTDQLKLPDRNWLTQTDWRILINWNWLTESQAANLLSKMS